MLCDVVVVQGHVSISCNPQNLKFEILGSLCVA